MMKNQEPRNIIAIGGAPGKPQVVVQRLLQGAGRRGRRPYATRHLPLPLAQETTIKQKEAVFLSAISAIPAIDGGCSISWGSFRLRPIVTRLDPSYEPRGYEGGRGRRYLAAFAAADVIEPPPNVALQTGDLAKKLWPVAAV
jgi:hypothetical protein